ncbi:MAG: hypothetical protein JJ975_09720, partial [Bacteroidia bacterium]|nr:hypothetical protein [Bacteroidia bacterium]
MTKRNSKPALLILKSTLDFIENLKQPVSGKLRLELTDGAVETHDTELKYNEMRGDYTLSFALNLSDRISTDTVYQSGTLTYEGHDLYLPDIFLTNFTNHVGVEDHQKVTGICGEMQMEKVTTGKYLRVVIPVRSRIRFDWILENNHTFSIGNMHYRGGWQGRYDNASLRIYPFKTDGQHYLIIDHEEATEYEEFIDLALAIRNGLGYLCGQIQGENLWVFMYPDSYKDQPEAFSFRTIRKFNTNGFAAVL